jgi:DNA anti-recombination protein RmuC
MVTRVSEFVAAMNDVSGKAGATNARVEDQLGTFNTVTAKVLNDLGELATQFNTHGRSLAEAVELLERSNRKTADGVAQRQTSIETLVSTLDARTGDFEERLRRFSNLLEESLDSATTRAREIASIIAETSSESVRTIEQQFELVRTTSAEERKRTGETLNAVYDQAAAQVHGVDVFRPRFTEIVAQPRYQHLTRDPPGRRHPGGAPPWHSRIAAGDLRERSADAPRHRRSDRGSRRA